MNLLCGIFDFYEHQVNDFDKDSIWCVDLFMNLPGVYRISRFLLLDKNLFFLYVIRGWLLAYFFECRMMTWASLWYIWLLGTSGNGIDKSSILVPRHKEFYGISKFLFLLKNLYIWRLLVAYFSNFLNVERFDFLAIYLIAKNVGQRLW